MIYHYPNTTVSALNKALVTIRDTAGSSALGRVLTLVIATEPGTAEEAIIAAEGAAREHPLRVIVLSTVVNSEPGVPRLDGEIRLGGDSGPSEVILLTAYGTAADDQEALVTGLLLPDAPVIAWWPGQAPERVAQSALGRIAVRRITDSRAQPAPAEYLSRLSLGYTPGDSDLAWTRLTLWRNQLAAVLDPPASAVVTHVDVEGADDSSSAVLLAAWLTLQLQAPVKLSTSRREFGAAGIYRVRLHSATGVVDLHRPLPEPALLRQPDQPAQDVSLPRRSLLECLTEELRHQGADTLYGDVITSGLAQLISSESGSGSTEFARIPAAVDPVAYA
ncbi:OpcA protein [Cryobacterium sp. TMS1-20-1]|uniref:glucose-6-phosphate dehydrogenase assembly protein OpcA n=1 Tax=Cryobacterium sp. TMS1-20-1 TaxID=1259223 RepID=UPI001069DAB8|nr:glucose-6-phosphate dehydrogenase assembly protein OpcA [Cryobacterium sp. TMS1-20-1]TFC79435.1 OpcA protein [Cryobacterium sp. TMS1-20-1]